MLHKDLTAPLSLKEVSFLLQLSTEQAFTASSLRAKSASPLTARYAHFTLTAPLLNATHTPVEIAKGSSSTPLTLDLNVLYIQLPHGRVKALQGASTTALTSTTSSATRPPAPTTSDADFTSLNPVRMHFIYRLHLENEHTSETAENLLEGDGLYKKRNNETGIYEPVYKIDLENESLAGDEQKLDFLSVILYGNKADNFGDISSRLENLGISLNSVGLYDKINDRKLKEDIGIYYQEETGGVGEDVPEANKTEKRVITYTMNY